MVDDAAVVSAAVTMSDSCMGAGRRSVNDLMHCLDSKQTARSNSNAKHGLATLVALLVVGCSPTVWTKPGLDQAQFNQDNAKCNIYAEGVNSHSLYVEGSTGFVAGAALADAIGTALSIRETYHNCMLAGGYTEVQPAPTSHRPPPAASPNDLITEPADDGWISKDGRVELKLNGHWKFNNIPTADRNIIIRLMNGEGAFLNVSSRDLRDIADLKIYSEEYGNRISKALPGSEIGSLESFTINNHQTFRFEFSSIAKGERVRCMVTIMQTESRVASITGCTLASIYASQQSLIMAAAKGLRETGH